MSPMEPTIARLLILTHLTKPPEKVVGEQLANFCRAIGSYPLKTTQRNLDF